MSVRLKRQRDGSLRDTWYGSFVDGGKRTEINLNVKWKGTPPPSGKWTESDDRDFETSRRKAEAALKAHVEEIRQKGRAEHLTEKLIESKTGRAVQYTRIADLVARWRGLGREATASKRYLAACDAHFNRFIRFMQAHNPSAVHLYEVTPEDAAAYVAHCRESLAPATAKYAIRLANKALSRFLPVGATNPFSDLIGRRSGSEAGIIHRKPFTPEELQTLLDCAKDDPFMHPLVVTAACTGMRRGDVCRLKWSDIDLAAGMLTAKANKTGERIEIPIYPPLRSVLTARQGKNPKGFVFPEAERMLRENSNGLSYRFKMLVVKAMGGEQPCNTQELAPVSEIESEVASAIAKRFPEGKRRARMLETLRRYALGASIRQIEKATGCARSTVSGDLQTMEIMLGKPFVRGGMDRPNMKAAVRRVTQAHREQGQRAASIRDWHALRATWVTLALSAGVPIELVKRVTGHATVEVVLRHYFRPGREQFKAVLAGALPSVLTGTDAKPTPAEELAALANKLAAGTATEEEKKRLRVLAKRI